MKRVYVLVMVISLLLLTACKEQVQNYDLENTVNSEETVCGNAGESLPAPSETQAPSETDGKDKETDIEATSDSENTTSPTETTNKDNNAASTVPTTENTTESDPDTPDESDPPFVPGEDETPMT